jgi:hypothetical protein
MADETGTPEGAPPKPAEAKVQPKKETVRIALPPKPTASPTIKLPTLPASGAPAAPAVSVPAAPAGAAPPAAKPATAAPAAPAAPAARPATAAPGAKLASTPAPKAAAPATAAKPGTAAAPTKAAAPKPPATVGVLDKVLAIVAFVISGAAVGTVLFLMNLLDKTQGMLDEIPK